MKIISNSYFFIFMISFSWSNISNIENNFTYSILLSSLDSSITKKKISSLVNNEKDKSTPLAMFSSLLIPGAGQIYMNNWKIII